MMNNCQTKRRVFTDSNKAFNNNNLFTEFDPLMPGGNKKVTHT